MYVSPINTLNRPIAYQNKTVKNNKIHQNTSFKSAEYAKAFTHFYDNLHLNIPNEQIYKELMTKAQKVSGAFIDDIAKVFFKPEDYHRVMEGSRKKEPIYAAINNQCYKSPSFLIKAGNSVLVSVMNLGVQGNLFDLLRFNLNEDLRICFHDINNSDKIICLGRDNKGVDQKFKTENGIDTIISAGTWSEFL